MSSIPQHNEVNYVLAIVTGLSTGIGLELAKRCGKAGYDRIASDEPEIERAVASLRAGGTRSNHSRPILRRLKELTGYMLRQKAVAIVAGSALMSALINNWHPTSEN